MFILLFILIFLVIDFILLVKLLKGLLKCERNIYGYLAKIQKATDNNTFDLRYLTNLLNVENEEVKEN